jgi:histidine triad (HIT) family protein
MTSTFEDIVSGKRSVHRVAEDECHIAFLSENPVRPGHVIVIPKKVADSLFDLSPADHAALMEFVRVVGLMLRKRLPCARVCIAAIGWQVRHAHVHLVPTDVDGQFPPLPGVPAHEKLLGSIALRLRDMPSDPSPAKGSFEINGSQPAIEGEICQAIVVSEYWHAGKLVSPSMIAFLRFADRWYRLYFDCDAIVYWRQDPEEPPAPYRMEELNGEVKNVDVGRAFGLVGQKLRRIAHEDLGFGLAVRLEFERDRALTFRSVGDIVTYG